MLSEESGLISFGKNAEAEIYVQKVEKFRRDRTQLLVWGSFGALRANSGLEFWVADNLRHVQVTPV